MKYKRNKNDENIANLVQVTKKKIDNIYLLYITNKQIIAIIYNKTITKINKKFDKIYIDLFDLYDSIFFQSKIRCNLLDAKTKKPRLHICVLKTSLLIFFRSSYQKLKKKVINQ